MSYSVIIISLYSKYNFAQYVFSLFLLCYTCVKYCPCYLLQSWYKFELDKKVYLASHVKIKMTLHF